MKALAIPATTAAMVVSAALSYGQTSASTTPGANPEFPTTGAPANAPTLQERVTKTPGSSVNPEFPTAGAPRNAPILQEEIKKTPGSRASPEFPAGEYRRDVAADLGRRLSQPPRAPWRAAVG
jgi:hypothetical protein